MDRKTFLEKAALSLVLGIPFLSFFGCSSNAPGPSNGSTKDCLANGTSSSIGANHGHSLSVSKIDVQNGTEKTYSIQGSAGHNHNITVTASDFASLQNNQQILVNSTVGAGHTHPVTVSCA